MKTSRIAPVATLALVFGFVALACAAQDRPSNDKDHPKQDNRQQQARPEQQHAQQQHSQQHGRPPTSGRPPSRSSEATRHSTGRSSRGRPRNSRIGPTTRPQNHTADNRGAPRPQQNQDRGAQEQGRGVQQTAWQQHSASNWQSDHRTWQQRGGYHGYRVPDARFRGYFGSGHAFLIRGLPFMVVGGFPRFQYNGYWLSVVDPWPQQWGNDWYDNDQVYVDYADGGYYLYNRSYPGVGIAVSISM